MTLQQLAELEATVNAGVRLRNKASRITAIKALFLELDNPLPGGVVKCAEVRMSANGAELRFIDLSNQSRNTSMEISSDDGRKLVALLREFLDSQLGRIGAQLEALT